MTEISNPKASDFKRQRTGILVLGMHRSGTSALSRLLNLLGCDLPKTLMAPAEGNVTGHWESSVICDLDDRIFAGVGSSWSDWAEFDPGRLSSETADKFRKEAIDALRYEFDASQLFVLKDPRICRVASFWRDAFEQAEITPKLITILRNPYEVAASLESRDGFVPALGCLLWLRHNLDAEFATRGMRRLFTSYDQLLANWRHVAERASATLGITFPNIDDQAVAADIGAFLSPSNRHHRERYPELTEHPQLSLWLRDSLAIFDRWAMNGECMEDFNSLEKIREEFSQATTDSSPLVGVIRHAQIEANRQLAETETPNETIPSSVSWRHSGPIRAFKARQRARRREHQYYQILKDSEWFDATWYLKTYKDVAEAGADPLMHYIRHGAAEGRDPGPQFDATSYLATNKRAQAAGVNPLVHFLRKGSSSPLEESLSHSPAEDASDQQTGKPGAR